MNLTVSYYWNSVLSTHRGIAHGKPSNAKPLFLLAIIEGIENGNILGNQIKYDDKLENSYLALCREFEPDTAPARFFKPFYHSGREEYYNLKWKYGKVTEHKWHTPSPKIIKENIDYGYLDDGFWELLQNKDYRNEFRDLIIHHFLQPTNNTSQR